jgi:hypothetical protein
MKNVKRDTPSYKKGLRDAEQDLRDVRRYRHLGNYSLSRYARKVHGYNEQASFSAFLKRDFEKAEYNSGRADGYAACYRKGGKI